MSNQQICQICDQLDITELVQLGCGHHFCKDCLNYYFKIDENFQLDIFECPLDDCKRKLDTNDLKKFVNNFDETIETLMKNNICFGLHPNERLITCFNQICKAQYIIWKDADYFSCSQCQKSYCLNCNQLKHNGETCIDIMRRQTVLRSFMDFHDQAQKKFNFKHCPKCAVLIEKNKGCNYITCESKICKGKTHFCYNCGQSLSKEELMLHYEKNDYFSGKCRVKVNGRWCDEKQLLPSNNNFSCPGCGTNNPNECQVEFNIHNQVVVCNSRKCQNKYYCLICSQQVNDTDVIEHFLGNLHCKVHPPAASVN